MKPGWRNWLTRKTFNDSHKEKFINLKIEGSSPSLGVLFLLVLGDGETFGGGS